MNRGNEDKNKQLTDDLNRLISITTHKRQRLKAISNMTKKQSEAIEQNDIDMLTCYIQEKQRHIDAIKVLDKEFSNIFDKGIKAGLDGRHGLNNGINPEGLELYKELQDAISEAQGIMSIVYEQEKDNSLKVNKLMDGIKQKIRHIQTGKKGHEAYNRPVAFSDGIYIDQKK